MIDTIKEHIAEVEKFTSTSIEEIEAFRIKYLGKKGLLNSFFAEFKNVPNEQKKDFGKVVNQLKTTATDKVNALKEALENQTEVTGKYGDLTRPGEPIEIGSRHPISIVKNQIIDIFSRIGFNVSEGPEVEDDWHNFTALNLPEYHPAMSPENKGAPLAKAIPKQRGNATKKTTILAGKSFLICLNIMIYKISLLFIG